MARWTPVPVAGGAYSDDCLPWASQDTVNYIPVNAEKAGTRSPAMLRCLPGCTTFSVTGSDAPVRGMRNVEGRLLAVSGNALYRIATDGTATSLGTIPGVARCSLAHNQISGGHEVAIANGQSGYIYNTATDTLAQITDEGFPGAKVFGFVDGFLMFIEPQGRFFGWSDLAAGTSYNTLDRSEAEAQPDRIVTGIESHGEWLVLGERSGEFYRNAGTTTGTFQRIPGTTMEVGCAGTHAVGKVDNSVIWVGNDGTVYRLNGYQPQRISTHAIEQQLSRCNLAQAFVTVFEDRGHKVVYITCPDGKTWGYDVATGEWHRRQSDGLNRWRMNALVRWQNQWMAGDFSNGRVYQLDWAIQHEAGAEMERRRTFPVMHDNQNALTVNALELVFDTGLSEASNPLPVPLLSPLAISGDLSDGEAGEVVSYQYTASGGLLPRSFAITAGALPDGLALSSSGLVTGTRTTAGAYGPWTVSVTDADGAVEALVDSSTTYALGPWMYGPVTQNGALGGGQAFYKQSSTLAGLVTAPVVALPLSMATLTRISVANRAVFMHGTPAGRVSFDAGNTWEACSVALDATMDVYWNGAYYYSGSLRSVDGKTWAAIPNLTGTPVTTLARASDGALICGYNTGGNRFEVSLDNGATWTVRVVLYGYPDASMATDGTRIWTTQNGSNGVYTSDLFSTQAPYAATRSCYAPYWGGGSLLVKSPVDKVLRSTDGVTSADVLTTTNTGTRDDPTICYSASNEWAVVKITAGTPIQGGLLRSTDGGATFASVGTVYGNGANLVYVKATP